MDGVHYPKFSHINKRASAEYLKAKGVIKSRKDLR